MPIEYFNNIHLIEAMRMGIKRQIDIHNYNLKQEKLSDFQKNRINKNINILNKALTELNFLKSRLGNLKRYNLPKELNDQIASGLKSLISKDEFDKLEIIINSEISKYNKTFKSNETDSLSEFEKIKKQINKVINFIKSGKKYKDKYSISYQYYEKTMNCFFTYEETMNELENRTLDFYKSSRLRDIFVPEKSLEDFKLSENLVKLKNVINGKSEVPSFFGKGDKKVQDLVNNFDQIEKAYRTKEKLKYTQKVLKEIIKALSLEKCDFSKTIKFLETKSKKIEKQIQSIEKYLNKFDLNYLEKLYIEEDKRNNYIRSVNDYKSLAYKLAEVKNNGDKTKEKEIEEELQKIAISGNISPEEQMIAKSNAKIDYAKDERIKESEKEAFQQSQEKLDYNGFAKSYIRYRASLKDKKDAMSYSEFVRKKYNIIANELMVSEELRDEIRGKSKK